MTDQVIIEAFRDESGRLLEELAAIRDAEFARPSPCPPWTVAELAFHVRMTIGRLPGMLAGPEPALEPAFGGLVSAAGYYRADQRFSDAVNTDRIESAQQGSAGLSGAAERASDFADVLRHALDVLLAAPAGRVVRTRHGDLMLLTEFLRTRVLELAVHGLDLAVALAREPWMTLRAAQVTEELLLPAPAAATLRARTGWDRVTVIGALTGRRPVTPDEARLIGALGTQRIALGQLAG